MDGKTKLAQYQDCLYLATLEDCVQPKLIYAGCQESPICLMDHQPEGLLGEILIILVWENAKQIRIGDF